MNPTHKYPGKPLHDYRCLRDLEIKLTSFDKRWRKLWEMRRTNEAARETPKYVIRCAGKWWNSRGET